MLVEMWRGCHVYTLLHDAQDRDQITWKDADDIRSIARTSPKLVMPNKESWHDHTPNALHEVGAPS